MMSLPTLVEPVKTIWFQGCSANAAATSGPPCTTASTWGSKRLATASASTWAVRGAISEGLSTARLPAANAQASGDSKVNRGAFQVPMMPITPLGWYLTQAVAPNMSKGLTLGRSESPSQSLR